MSDKLRCQQVREKILSISKDKGKLASCPVLDHLTECERCRRLYATCRKIDQTLAEEKIRLLASVGQAGAGKEGILTEIVSSSPRRDLRRLRPAWAGAIVLLLGVAGASAVYFLKRGGAGPQEHVKPSAPQVTHAVAAEASYETLREFAEVVRRHQAPSPELPYTPPMPARESFVPGLLQQTVAESEDTLSMIVGSTTRLTRRQET
jgi:hypothetical protein